MREDTGHLSVKGQDSERPAAGEGGPALLSSMVLAKC